MTNFKFLRGQKEDEEPVQKIIMFHFDLLVNISQVFDVPEDFDLGDLSGEELYQRLITDFPSENRSIYHNINGPLDDAIEGIEVLEIDFIEEGRYDEDDNLQWRVLNLD